jgi:hypothetical protein
MMKKVFGITLLSCGLLLAGCGQEVAKEDAEKKVQEDVSKVNKQDDKQSENEQEAVTNNEDTEMPENATGIQDGKYDITNDTGYIKLLGMFEGDLSSKKDLTTTIDFNGFKISLIPSLVDVELSPEAQADEKYKGKTNTKAIMVVMEVENTLDDDVDYNGTFTVVTDTGEQLSSDNGIGSSNEAVQTYYGKVKQSGYDVLPLDGDKLPKSIKIIMDPPNKLVNGAFNGNEDLGGEKRIEFDKLVTE